MNMKMNQITALALCLGLLGGLIAMTSCGEKSEEGLSAVTEPVTLPDMADDRIPSEDVAADYEAKLDAAFSTTTPASAEHLTYTMDDEGVTLTGYNGPEVIVVLPDTVEGMPVIAIAAEAFADTGLRALYIPDSVKTIGVGALKGCKNLATLRTPLVTAETAEGEEHYFGALFGATTYEVNASAVPDALTTVIVGGAVDTIPAYAFYDCNSITCIRLPETVETIEKFAFWGCSSLVWMDLSETALTEIGARALTNCAALLQFRLPATVIRVGEGVVEGCGSLETMTLPFVGETATEHTYLGYLFGASHYTFTEGFVPVSLMEISVLEGCTAIPDNAFFGVSCVSHIDLPQTVTAIGRRAFYGCERLTSLTLPDGVTTVGDDAFHGCIRLTDFMGGESLSSLGVQAFMDCLSLKTVDLPVSLTAIPNSCFAGCISLETVTAPGVTSADSVGKQAYRHCEKLTDAPYLAEEPIID